MGATNNDGPLFVYGDLDQIESTPGGTILLPNPNPDRGPSMLFGGYGLPDTRYMFLKDLVQGYAGRVPQLLVSPGVVSANAIPAAHSTNGIAASQHTTSGTALTLATTAAYGFTPSIPIIPFTGGAFNSGSVTTAALTLDFGFCYGTTTTGSTAQTVTVLDSTIFYVGMPIIIGSAGAASGTTPLLTWVTGLASATTITINDPALQAGSYVIGTGNIWSPSEFGQLEPTAAYPAIGMGPGLFMDPRQCIARGIVTTVSAGTSSSNHLVVHGWDIYGEPMTESIACSAATNYGKKAFKYIGSVVPDFTDNTNNYTVGTSDVFGFAQRADYLEETLVWWDSALVVGTAATSADYGFVAADTTNPATTTTGDVRGTFQPSNIGGTSGPALNASNGSVSTITISGKRLRMQSAMTVWQQTQNRLTAPQFGFGQLQV